jgi:hypothetical protein
MMLPVSLGDETRSQFYRFRLSRYPRSDRIPFWRPFASLNCLAAKML